MSLTNEEQAIVMSGIDKYDYSSMGFPRYLDLKSVTKQVQDAKQANPGKKLKAVMLTESLESFPPCNTYEIVME